MERSTLSRNRLSNWLRSPLLATILVLMFAGTAFATVASNFSPTLTSRGTLNHDMHINTDAIKFQTKGDVDLVTATVNFGASGSSGWHSHPGIVLVTVQSGSLVVYDATCAATNQPAGSAFVESGDSPLLVRNESTTTGATVLVTYIEPAGTPNSGLRIDRSNPGCPQS
jgi:hypothetical protein